VSLDLLHPHEAHPHEAVERVRSATSPSTAEEVALSAALGRVPAADVTSREAVPGFDNSAMDGFAVRAAETGGARRIAPRLSRSWTSHGPAGRRRLP